jgi:hypothetical protein
MATLTSTTILSDNSTDAIFRAWASWIHSVFMLGWTDTAATGQIDFTTVVKPAALNTSQGFKVYAMADTLQATAPVFVKIEFGSAGAAATPGIWMTIGTTHDGAGTIGGVLFARQQMVGSGQGATAETSYGSAASNRVTIALWVSVAASVIFFGIERTKDSSGADTNVGLIFSWFSSTSALSTRSHYLPFAGTIPAFQNGYHIVLTQTTPSTLNGNVGVSATIPMGYDAKQPGMNHCVCLVNDFANFADVPITMYGTSRNFKHLGANISSLRNQGGGAVGDTNTRLLMRFE